MNTFYKQAQDLQEAMIRHRRWLHSHPEVGFGLKQTRSYVRRMLEQMGLEPKECGQCGLVADIKGKPGAVLLLRADMDALPITEEAQIPFASANGNMHACGHDLHTSMLLGAAKLLLMHRRELDGTVRLMFQPAEEILAGAQDMIRCGVLDSVQGAAMIHVAVGTDLPTGTMMVAPAGVSAPAAAFFNIKVTGQGCHGAAPHKGIDALTTAAHILIALQEIPAREIPAGTEAVLTFGTLQAGTADNAIAGEAELRGTLRAFDGAIFRNMRQRVEDISRGIAEAFRAKAEVHYTASCPPLVNDPGFCALAGSVLRETLGQERVLVGDALPRSIGGSEDFAYVSQMVPAVMLSLAAGAAKDGYTDPLHHPKVTFDEEAMVSGCAALAALATEFLKNPSGILQNKVGPLD